MKTLYIISKGMDKPSDEVIRQLEKDDKIPRVSLLEDAISAVLLDERYLYEKPPYWRRQIYKRMPVSYAQLIEAIIIQNRFEVVVSHTEKVSFPLALWMKWFRSTNPHIVIVSRITSVDENKSKWKIWFLKQTAKSVYRFLIWSSMQRKIAIEQFGVPTDKIILLKRGVDQKFWRPMEQETDMICSVGMEARDYPTLVNALREFPIPCHIAAGLSRGDIFNTIERLHNIQNIPEWITVGKKNPADLRSMYARSRFTVISLLETDSDNGLTAILETMAMGKPVICTRTQGQIDIIQEGVTGIYVPQGDSFALRNAIESLWNDPERCKKMGEAARDFIVKYHNIEQFVSAIKYEVNRSSSYSITSYPIKATSTEVKKIHSEN
ncbi:MAG: glycosyltransferase family 4 protein [Balneolales bacterium]|nr:glycosyltransferase family 4 protein [Balneolales bacterium]